MTYQDFISTVIAVIDFAILVIFLLNTKSIRVTKGTSQSLDEEIILVNHKNPSNQWISESNALFMSSSKTKGEK